MTKRHGKLFIFFSLIIGFILIAFLEYQGIIWHNSLFAWQYPIKGLDVSNHQGAIDWKLVANTKRYTFVYIKATEGHDYTDDYFLKNWKEAKKNGLLVGAYQFFSTRSSGAEQASFFIAFVPKANDALPPVVDVEIDLKKDPTKIREELTNLLIELENYYHKQPILYVRYDTYNAYIKGYFSEYPLWVRDIFKFPTYNSDWLIWQYSNRGRVNGIQNYVDINVFKGTKKELLNLTK